VAIEICKLLDRHPEKTLSDFRRDLPRTWTTPTMSPFCSDEEKHAVLGRIVERLLESKAQDGLLAGRRISDVVTVNGARVLLENGAWGLVRASSNTPNLVVVCESPDSESEMRQIFEDLDALIRTEPAVGSYDQRI
jgi:phosphomannomutase / phosphoglucomutase